MSNAAGWSYLNWDEAKIAKFHNFLSGWGGAQDDYFSKQVGRGVINFLKCVAPIKGRVLDYGCGPGYLVNYLLAAGIRCEGAEVSPEAVNIVNKRFSASHLWGGAKCITGKKLPYPDHVFDLIIGLEIIEHMIPEQIESTLVEMRRALKPNSGLLFLTTPNSEDLSQSQVYCVNCGSVFHRFQHISSFSTASLGALMAKCGFVTLYCAPTDFRKFQYGRWLLCRIFSCFLARAALKLNLVGLSFAIHRLFGLINGGPHLFWIGKKL